MSAQRHAIPDGWPLKWASRYHLSRGGVLYRTDVVQDVTLAKAEQYARGDAAHDPERAARSGNALGRSGGGPLTFAEDGQLMAASVFLMPPAARAELQAAAPTGGVTTYLHGLVLPVGGDVARGWYFVKADDGARWIFHGPTYARHYANATQGR